MAIATKTAEFTHAEDDEMDASGSLQWDGMNSSSTSQVVLDVTRTKVANESPEQISWIYFHNRY